MSNSINQSDSTALAKGAAYRFTQHDRDVLRAYEPVVDGLALLLGSHCEIVLHSLEDLEHSAIRITNGEHTGRKLGSPVTNLALQKLHQFDKQQSQLPQVYFTRAKSGVLMKSMTIAIRNSSDQVIGLLCINLNLDVPFSQIMATFMPPEIQPDIEVNFANSVDELVMQTLEHTIEEVSNDRRVANNTKNRHIVLNLFEKGIFDIKDAINQVADRLNISKHTVYLYIRQFRQGDIHGEDV